MPLQLGARLGSYEVVGALGAGGMGEVYRARDVKLQRDVAIKALPPPFAEDPERVARFEREAQALAALNHPGIAGIHELLEHQGSRYLVLEYVAGQTLAAQLALGPLPLDEALAIAKDIADALEAAHEKGIIHRDLKPANVIITPEGRTKVLDFGLAKALDPMAGASAVISQSPTMISMSAGVILGTAAYMSPEQARGKPVDRRADIWAFGCVLYEMLTGTQAFSGETVTDVISAVMRADPDWSLLPADTPLAVHRLLRRCLTKDARERLPHIGVARFDLHESAPPAVVTPAGDAHRATVLLWLALVIAATTAAILTGLLLTRREPPSLGTVRFDIDTPPETMRLGHFAALRGAGVPAPHFAVSPNGRAVAFTAVDHDNSAHLWVRSLTALTPRRLPGTVDASFPFWSPDGRAIAFFAGGALKTIGIDAETPLTICPVDNGEGGSWGPNDTILFGSRRGPIRRVSAHGGTPSEVTRLADNAAIHNWPYFLADGQSFVYFAGKVPGESAVRLRTLASGDEVELVNFTSRAVVAAGHLLWVREGQLMAQPLDARSRRLTGEPRVIAGNVAFNPGGGGRAAFHASDSGVLVYRLGTTLEQDRLTWWSREAKQINIVDQGKNFGAVVLSPDGSRAVVQVNEAVETLSNADLWTYEFSTGVRTRFTTEPGVEWAPAWSPDGQSIAYSTSDARGQIASASVWIKPAGGAQPARKISDAGVVSTWLPDGSGLLVTRTNPKTGNDVWMIPLSGGSEQPLLQTSFDERDAQYSPDGRWLSYITNESGEFDIYVQPVPATGRKWRVTPDGGTSPQWSKDSRELFFSYRGHIHVATVSSSGVSTPTVVVRDAVETNPARGSARRFAVSPDGQRLLAVRSPVAPNDTPITLILNWPELLRR